MFSYALHVGKASACLLTVVFVYFLPQTTPAQGFEETTYEGQAEGGTLSAAVTVAGAFSEKYWRWTLNVARDGTPFLSDYPLSPFYSWTCIQRGRSRWESKSVLSFMNLSAQGRAVSVHVTNTTGKAVPCMEVWVKSVAADGYPHSPSLSLILDAHAGTTHSVRPEIFPGAEYFTVKCVAGNQSADMAVRVPARRDWPHDIDLDDPKKRIRIKLSADGPSIDGGAFEALTAGDLEALVPGGPRLHLSEKSRRHAF